METVWKFPISMGINQIHLNWTEEILSAGIQGMQLAVWARVKRTDARGHTKRTVVVAGTGHDLPDAPLRFIGRVTDGPFEWHVFEVKP